MEPRRDLSWRERVNFNARVSHRLRSSIQRLRDVWWQILQTALAAGGAWFLAVLILGHERPEFAPIAAGFFFWVGGGGGGRRGEAATPGGGFLGGGPEPVRSGLWG